MKEATLKKKAREILEKRGYQIWFPVQVMYTQKDIFGVWDFIAWKGNNFLLVQLTTMPNRSTRVKKITKYMKENNLSLPSSYVKGQGWGWDNKLRFFKIVDISRGT